MWAGPIPAPGSLGLFEIGQELHFRNAHVFAMGAKKGSACSTEQGQCQTGRPGQVVPRPRLTGDDTEALGGEVTCSESQNQYIGEEMPKPGVLGNTLLENLPQPPHGPLLGI